MLSGAVHPVPSVRGFLSPPAPNPGVLRPPSRATRFSWASNLLIPALPSGQLTEFCRAGGINYWAAVAPAGAVIYSLCGAWPRPWLCAVC